MQRGFLDMAAKKAVQAVRCSCVEVWYLTLLLKLQWWRHQCVLQNDVACDWSMLFSRGAGAQRAPKQLDSISFADHPVCNVCTDADASMPDACPGFWE